MSATEHRIGSALFFLHKTEKICEIPRWSQLTNYNLAADLTCLNLRTTCASNQLNQTLKQTKLETLRSATGFITHCGFDGTHACHTSGRSRRLCAVTPLSAGAGAARVRARSRGWNGGEKSAGQTAWSARGRGSPSALLEAPRAPWPPAMELRRDIPLALNAIEGAQPEESPRSSDFSSRLVRLIVSAHPGFFLEFQILKSVIIYEISKFSVISVGTEILLKTKYT